MRELISDDFSGYIITSLTRFQGQDWQTRWKTLYGSSRRLYYLTLTSLVFGMLNFHGFIVSRPRPTTCSETDA